MILATFIGFDHSMGYRTGKQYRIDVSPIEGRRWKKRYNGGTLLVIAPFDGGTQPCPYTSLETLLLNWKIEYPDFVSVIDSKDTP